MMTDTTSFYISFTSSEYFFDTHNTSTTIIATSILPQYQWKKKHWKLFYTHDEKQYYIIELAGAQGVRHRAILHHELNEEETGYTQKQKLFDVIYPLDALRYELHAAFSKEKYNAHYNNCRHFVLQIVKQFLVPLFPVINMTLFAEEVLLGLSFNDLTLSRFNSFLSHCPSNPSSPSTLLLADNKDCEVSRVAAEIEATLSPLPPSVQSVCNIPTEVRVGLRLLALGTYET